MDEGSDDYFHSASHAEQMMVKMDAYFDKQQVLLISYNCFSVFVVFDWVKRCIMWEVEGIRQRGRPKKTWWDCVKNDMESLSLSQKDAQSRNKWMRITGQPANPGSPGKMAVKAECVCVCFCYKYIG